MKTIWFFGASHTDGFADGKLQDSKSYPTLVSEQTGYDIINFATSGANNTQTYKFMKMMLLESDLKKPDIVIIEPRTFFDFQIFPRLMLNGKMDHKIITWRNDKDAYYSGWWNDYVKMHTAFQKVSDTFGRNKKINKVLKDLHSENAMDRLDHVQIVDKITGDLKWVPRENFDYTAYVDWYETTLVVFQKLLESNHELPILKLDQEMSSMIYLAKTVTNNVGYLFWDIYKYPKSYSIELKKSLNHLKEYDILGQSVHSLLENNHPKEYEISKQTYLDDHLGPEAHVALAPYITEWVKKC